MCGGVGKYGRRQGCELDRFLTKFEFKRYLLVRARQKQLSSASSSSISSSQLWTL